MFNFEAKFFIYANNTQLGPLQKRDVIDEIEKQNLGEDAYIWSEGMPSWERLKEHLELKEYVQYLPAKTNLFKLQKSIEGFTESLDQGSSGGPDSGLERIEDDKSTSAYTQPVPNTKPVVQKRTFYVAILAVALFILAGLYWRTHPREVAWELLDATAEQIDEMKWTVNQSRNEKALFSVARFKGNNNEPRLAIATNLPEETVLKFEFHGIRSTLLGALSARIETQVDVRNGLAITPALRRADGAFLPVGAYKVHVTCLSCGEGLQGLWLPTPIIVGDVNSYYKADLEKFRLLQKQQAESEAFELNESYSFLNRVISDRIRKKSLSADQNEMFQQLGNLLNEHSPAAMSEHYVLAPLYRELLVVHNGLKQKPAELGQLRRMLDAFKARHRQITMLAKKNLTEVLDLP